MTDLNDYSLCTKSFTSTIYLDASAHVQMVPLTPDWNQTFYILYNLISIYPSNDEWREIPYYGRHTVWLSFIVRGNERTGVMTGIPVIRSRRGPPRFSTWPGQWARELTKTFPLLLKKTLCRKIVVPQSIFGPQTRCLDFPHSFWLNSQKKSFFAPLDPSYGLIMIHSEGMNEPELWRYSDHKEPRLEG